MQKETKKKLSGILLLALKTEAILAFLFFAVFLASGFTSGTPLFETFFGAVLLTLILAGILFPFVFFALIVSWAFSRMLSNRLKFFFDKPLLFSFGFVANLLLLFFLNWKGFEEHILPWLWMWVSSAVVLVAFGLFIREDKKSGGEIIQTRLKILRKRNSGNRGLAILGLALVVLGALISFAALLMLTYLDFSLLIEFLNSLVLSQAYGFMAAFIA